MDKLNDEIKDSIAYALYFSGPNCGVCQALKPKITTLLKEDFPDIEIGFCDISVNPEISSQYSVYSIPTIIIFFEGKEFVRRSRNISIPLLKDEIQRPYNIIFKS